MNRIYIAGPMRGIKFFNFPAFDEAKNELFDQGFEEVVSPASMDRKAGFNPLTLGEDQDWNDSSGFGFSLSRVIDRDISAIKTCGSIYMLRGWQNSKGATAEKALAEWMGLTVIYQDEEDVQDEEDILEEALRITRGDRNASYGPPDQDFQRTAAMWSAIKGIEFEARDVALFMIALKLSRETHQRKRDNWVDMAGYARCGSLCK